MVNVLPIINNRPVSRVLFLYSRFTFQGANHLFDDFHYWQSVNLSKFEYCYRWCEKCLCARPEHLFRKSPLPDAAARASTARFTERFWHSNFSPQRCRLLVTSSSFQTSFYCLERLFYPYSSDSWHKYCLTIMWKYSYLRVMKDVINWLTWMCTVIVALNLSRYAISILSRWADDNGQLVAIVIDEPHFLYWTIKT